MYKNQLQELAQRSCFNLPSYACTREGLDHAPRFKASVNFNGEIFESPSYFNTLRQAEHAAAQVALSVLSTRGSSRSLTTRVLDETGVYKNLLQETAHRGGLKLPVYATVRSGPGHAPVFTSTVEIAAMNFTGESAKTKKQAEKNAAISAWSALKKLPNLGSLPQSIKEANNREENGSKQVRRDQNQTRRRMYHHQQWRYLDLLLDYASDGPTQKQSPPPRTRLLLPSASPGDDSLLSSTTRPNPIRSSSVTSLFEQTHIRSRLLGSATPSPRALSPIKTPSVCSQMGGRRLSMCTGGYNNPERIAPAVQMRSVIPVCATPPLPVRLATPSNPPSAVIQIQAASSASSATSMSNNPESYSTKFSSVFNKKLQL